MFVWCFLISLSSIFQFSVYRFVTSFIRFVPSYLLNELDTTEQLNWTSRFVCINLESCNLAYFLKNVFGFIALLLPTWDLHCFLWGVCCAKWDLSLWPLGSAVAVNRLSCSIACVILVPKPRIKPTSPALQVGFSTTGPPGKSISLSLTKFIISLIVD